MAVVLWLWLSFSLGVLVTQVERSDTHLAPFFVSLLICAVISLAGCLFVDFARAPEWHRWVGFGLMTGIMLLLASGTTDAPKPALLIAMAYLTRIGVIAAVTFYSRRFRPSVLGRTETLDARIRAFVIVAVVITAGSAAQWWQWHASTPIPPGRYSERQLVDVSIGDGILSALVFQDPSAESERYYSFKTTPDTIFEVEGHRVSFAKFNDARQASVVRIVDMTVKDSGTVGVLNLVD